MIPLNSKYLSKSTSDHLVSKQNDVNRKSTFDLQSERAKALWNSKTSANSGEKAFTEIKEKLIEMCVGVEICNYCENNEATDIEHIYPKSHFPERAFVWDNYLLACKNCNTTYKSDKFSVFNPANSNEVNKINRESGKPPTDDSVLLNPRIENPLDFLILDIQGKTFRFVAIPSLNQRDKEKAKYTLELLALNDRDALVEGRRAAAHYFISRLEKYVLIRESNDFPALEVVVTDLDYLDLTKPFNQEKNRLLASVKAEILKYAHPTVWREFVRQKNNLNKTKDLLNRAPEALTWI